MTMQSEQSVITITLNNSLTLFAFCQTNAHIAGQYQPLNAYLICYEDRSVHNRDRIKMPQFLNRNESGNHNHAL